MSESDDLSGLGGFFFYMFIIHPCTAWILRPGRFERSKSIIYAIAFLAGVAAIKSGTCFGKERNDKKLVSFLFLERDTW
jgi:hypothetical protein